MFTWPLNDGEGHLTETQSFLHITESQLFYRCRSVSQICLLVFTECYKVRCYSVLFL